MGSIRYPAGHGGQPRQLFPIEPRRILLEREPLDSLEPARISLFDKGLPGRVGRHRQQPAGDVPRQLRRAVRPGVPAEKAEVAEQQLRAGGRAPSPA